MARSPTNIPEQKRSKLWAFRGANRNPFAALIFGTGQGIFFIRVLLAKQASVLLSCRVARRHQYSELTMHSKSLSTALPSIFAHGRKCHGRKSHSIWP